MATPPIEQIIASAQAGRADAQFLLSQICLQRGDFEGMQRWLTAACESGHADALGAFGHAYEKGQGVAADREAALEYYDRAVAAGSKIAAFSKAQLMYKSSSETGNTAAIRSLLIDAARAGVVPALRVIGYLAMQQEASAVLARACLHRAAAQGDPVSCFNLAWGLSQNRLGSYEHSEPAHWMTLAAQADYPHAKTLLRSLGVPPQVPPAINAEPRFDSKFPLFPEVNVVDHQELSADPPIRVFDDVLNIADCAYLMFHARPHLKRASVIDPDGDTSGKVSKVRTNKSTYIPFELVDIISRYVELKIIGRIGEDLSCSEPMSILCYAPGEYYKPHFDFFNPRLKVSEEFMHDGGQRTASAITYLAAPESGGGTSFPKLDIAVPAAAGATLWFRNCSADGEVDERSLHAGDPVESGDKWVVTKWFRQSPTSYLPS